MKRLIDRRENRTSYYIDYSYVVPQMGGRKLCRIRWFINVILHNYSIQSTAMNNGCAFFA